MLLYIVLLDNMGIYKEFVTQTIRHTLNFVVYNLS